MGRYIAAAGITLSAGAALFGLRWWLGAWRDYNQAEAEMDLAMARRGIG
jgi:hypothetical protein